MTDGQLPRAAARRRFVYAAHGDSLSAVAAREFPDDPQAEHRLMSWNLHLVVRRSPSGEAGRLLGTDLVYIEAPLA
jgi:hypothetical protein